MSTLAGTCGEDSEKNSDDEKHKAQGEVNER